MKGVGRLSRKAHIKAYARKLHRKHGLSSPVELEELGNKLGIDLFYEPMPEKVNGTTLRLCDDSYLIIVNTRQITTRMRFTIAHELGHILLAHMKRGVSLSSAATKPDRDEYLMEREADIFASELLIPTPEIKALYFRERIKSISELAENFNVSKKAIQVKLKEIGVF